MISSTVQTSALAYFVTAVSYDCKSFTVSAPRRKKRPLFISLLTGLKTGQTLTFIPTHPLLLTAIIYATKDSSNFCPNGICSKRHFPSAFTKHFTVI